MYPNAHRPHHNNHRSRLSVAVVRDSRPGGTAVRPPRVGNEHGMGESIQPAGRHSQSVTGNPRWPRPSGVPAIPAGRPVYAGLVPGLDRQSGRRRTRRTSATLGSLYTSTGRRLVSGRLSVARQRHRPVPGHRPGRTVAVGHGRGGHHDERSKTRGSCQNRPARSRRRRRPKGTRVIDTVVKFRSLATCVYDVLIRFRVTDIQNVRNQIGQFLADRVSSVHRNVSVVDIEWRPLRFCVGRRPQCGGSDQHKYRCPVDHRFPGETHVAGRDPGRDVRMDVADDKWPDQVVRHFPFRLPYIRRQLGHHR